MDFAIGVWTRRVALCMNFSLSTLIVCGAYAQVARVSAQTWPVKYLEATSADPIVLSDNTTEALDRFSLGPGQPVHVRWHALYWERESLSLVRVDKVRLENVPFEWTAPLNKFVRATPDVPGKPLMMIRGNWIDEASTTNVPAQTAGILRTRPVEGSALNELLREGLSKPVSLSGKNWTLKTQVLKNSEGRLLPGSLELQLAGADGKSVVVLGRAPGHIFKEQRVLWAGDLNGDGLPDFLIRRILVTGHIDNIISLSTGGARYTAAGITTDPDQAESRFTSGVGELEEQESIFANSPSPYPELVLPSKDEAGTTKANAMRYALSGVMPLNRFELFSEKMRSIFLGTPEPSSGAAAQAQPAAISLPLNRVIKDMRFEFDGETYRLLVESVETYAGDDVGYRSGIAFGEYGGPGTSLQVSVYHRGQRQVLLVTGLPMESGMSFSAGDLDGSGKLSFTIDYYPHYNNGMTYTWRRSEKPGQLFQRTVVYQSQGC